MHVQMVMPESKLTVLLPGAKFSDAYRLVVDEPDLDAITAARRVLERSPRWIRWLMRLRNQITSLFGLKPAELALHDRREGSANVGAFPIISNAPERVVLGFDDKHLDFVSLSIWQISTSRIVKLRRRHWSARIICSAAPI